MLKTIIKHEFLFTIKRKVFYLVTLGMPLIAVAYIGLVSLIAYLSVPGELKRMGKPLGLVDHSGILVGEGGELNSISEGEVYEFHRGSEEIERLKEILPADLEQFEMPGLTEHIMVFDSQQEAEQALRDERLRSLVVIPDDFVESGRLQHYFRERSLIGSPDRLRAVRTLLTRNMLRQGQMTENQIARIQDRPSIAEYELSAAGEFVEVNLWSKGFSMGVPMGVAALLIVALMMNSSLLLASVAEEKENKVIEVILSSVSADQLLFGKVLGLVAAGLLQIVIWLIMASVVPTLIMSAIGQQVAYDVNVLHIGIGVLFVILGFVFYGCLLAGIGSMGSTYKECQQLTVAIILCACVPLMTLMTFLNDPNGGVATVLSLVPLFSPIAMMLRLGAADVPIWQVLLSFAVLLVFIWLAVKFSARLFRTGTLMYGKRPGLKQILKAVRDAA